MRFILGRSKLGTAARLNGHGTTDTGPDLSYPPPERVYLARSSNVNIGTRTRVVLTTPIARTT